MDDTYIASIIIPCYNAEKSIESTMQSVKYTIRCSKVKNIEIIIINDGSTDSTLDKIYNFDWEGLSENITIVNNDNHGVAYTRNMGLDLAKGNYVGFIDSDDVWLKPMIFLLMNLKNIKADIIEFNAKRLYNDIDDLSSPCLYPYIKKTGFVDENHMANYKQKCCDAFFFPSWGRLYNKSILSNLRFPLLSTYEDILFVASAILKSKRIFTLNESCLGYKDNPLSLTNNRNPVDVDNIHYVIEECYIKFKSHNDIISFKLLFNAYLLMVDNLAHQNKMKVLKEFSFYKNKLVGSPYFKEEILKKKVKLYFPVSYANLYVRSKNYLKKKSPKFFFRLKNVLS